MEWHMRLPKLDPAKLDSRQREVHDAIIRKRGKVGAPYRIWLNSPELCEKVEALGAYCRWDCSLPEKLREFSLCLAARHFDAQYSWNEHVGKAIEAGIAPEIMQAVAEKRTPKFKDKAEQAFYDFTTELLRSHFVSESTFTRSREIFGDRGLVDIVGCVGNFSMLAMCLNAFEADLQPGKQPFPDIRGYARVRPEMAVT
jgi:4-carboxymuconolactone decarboxylase